MSFTIALVILYNTNSTLPWWGFIVSLLLATISILFFGAIYAITGIQILIQTFVQMIGGYLHPGKPVANMAATNIALQTPSPKPNSYYATSRLLSMLNYRLVLHSPPRFLGRCLAPS
ncbi:hypothetical protein AZE42_11541 [Rhizopogon vesiculosus]|uniref:Uncharacterized protein n=1 Tax=Rhizopogon vesiculosus TaxID=180088 RepID=A0A1J8QB56_9AGAM|nr:hypothetical protein AZE42_11541 [Rhizopogon vesiculosus]